MESYFSLLSDNLIYLLGGVLFVALVGGIVYLFILRNKKVKIDNSKAQYAVDGIKSEKPAIIPLLGAGKFQCVAIRCPSILGLDDDANVLDFTTMPKPVGEVHFADTSCPFRGQFYTVKEKPDGTIEDWDYKSKKIVAEETPEFAYDATHPPDITPIFRAKYQFWKDSSFYYGLAAVVLAFFSVMGAMG